MILLSLLFSFTLTASAEQIPTEVESAIAAARARSLNVDQMLTKYASSRNASVWSQVFVEILREEPWVTFRVIENKLRRLNIDIYLVAQPAANTPDFCPRLFTDPVGMCRDYSLWIGVAGRVEAMTQMQAWGANEAQNLERLGTAGVLMIRPGLRRL